MSEPIDNPYRAPDAVVAEVGGDATTRADFYVVSPLKCALLLVGTAGLYPLYWFYKNWKQLDQRHKQYWPVPRAMFWIFFTHSLFIEVDHKLRREGKAYRWSPRWLASIAVACTLAGNAVNFASDRVVEEAQALLLTSVVAIAVQAIFWWTLYRAQFAINVACDDPGGRGNHRITVYNALWMLLGAALWAMNVWAWWLLLTVVDLSNNAPTA